MQKPRRLRLAVLAAAVLILRAQGVATALLVTRSRETAVVTASDTLVRIARAVEASINRNFVQVDAMLAGLPAVLAPFATGGRLDIGLVNRLLRELNSQNFTYRDVLLLGPEGMPVATGLAVSRRRPLPLSVQTGFAEVATRGGTVAIGGPVQNPATGEWTLFFARNLTLPGLGPVTTVAEVPVPLVQTLLGVGGEAPGLRVTLERADGTLLASLPHDETRIGQRLNPAAAALLA
jgi:hypothetical protein